VRVDGEACSARDAYALFYYGVISGYVHPKIHAMAGWISRYRRLGGVFRRMHLYTTMMNEVSRTAARSLGDRACPAALARALADNARPGVWRHAKLEELEAKNRFVWFVVRARRALAQSLKQSEVPVHPEIFFLGSVLHSLDHALLYENTHWSALLASARFRVDARLFAFLFIGPTRGFVVDTRMRSADEPWIRRAYQALSAIDAEFANKTHYCISW
jgi:hypothetical protein